MINMIYTDVQQLETLTTEYLEQMITEIDDQIEDLVSRRKEIEMQIILGVCHK